MCLGCHGPFDKLVAAANYVTATNEKISPHRYIPHDSKDAVNIPECANCHSPHAIPPPATMPANTANVDWCYATCHHQNNFTPCQECHPEMKK
jgi:hypothetical protein